MKRDGEEAEGSGEKVEKEQAMEGDSEAEEDEDDLLDFVDVWDHKDLSCSSFFLPPSEAAWFGQPDLVRLQNAFSGRVGAQRWTRQARSDAQVKRGEGEGRDARSAERDTKLTGKREAKGEEKAREGAEQGRHPAGGEHLEGEEGAAEKRRQETRHREERGGEREETRAEELARPTSVQVPIVSWACTTNGACSCSHSDRPHAQSGERDKDPTQVAQDYEGTRGAVTSSGTRRTVPFDVFLHYWVTKREKEHEMEKAEEAGQEASEKAQTGRIPRQWDLPVSRVKSERDQADISDCTPALSPFVRKERRPCSFSTSLGASLSPEEKQIAAELSRSVSPWYLADWHFVVEERKAQERAEDEKPSSEADQYQETGVPLWGTSSGAGRGSERKRTESSEELQLRLQEPAARRGPWRESRNSVDEVNAYGGEEGRPSELRRESWSPERHTEGEESHLYFASQFYHVPTFFQDDWFLKCPIRSGEDYRFAYLGPRGTRTPWHSDVLGTSSWSANVCGIKRWVFERTKRRAAGRLQLPAVSAPSSEPSSASSVSSPAAPGSSCCPVGLSSSRGCPMCRDKTREGVSGARKKGAAHAPAKRREAPAASQPCSTCGRSHRRGRERGRLSPSRPSPAICSPSAPASSSLPSPEGCSSPPSPSAVTPSLALCPRPLDALLQFPGECIYVPSHVHHRVCNVTDCIALNHNWCNAANILHVADALKEDLSDVRSFLMEDFPDARPVLLSLVSPHSKESQPDDLPEQAQEGSQALQSLSCAFAVAAASSVPGTSGSQRCCSGSSASPALGSALPEKPPGGETHKRIPVCEICGRGASLPSVWERENGKGEARDEKVKLGSPSLCDRGPSASSREVDEACVVHNKEDPTVGLSAHEKSGGARERSGETAKARQETTPPDCVRREDTTDGDWAGVGPSCVCVLTHRALRRRGVLRKEREGETGGQKEGETRQRGDCPETTLRRATRSYAELVMCEERVLSANCGVTFFDFFFFLLNVARTLLLPRLRRYIRMQCMHSPHRLPGDGTTAKDERRSDSGPVLPNVFSHRPTSIEGHAVTDSLPPRPGSAAVDRDPTEALPSNEGRDAERRGDGEERRKDREARPGDEEEPRDGGEGSMRLAGTGKKQPEQEAQPAREREIRHQRGEDQEPTAAGIETDRTRGSEAGTAANQSETEGKQNTVLRWTFDILGALRVSLLLRALYREGYVAFITRAQVELRKHENGDAMSKTASTQNGDGSPRGETGKLTGLPSWLVGDAGSVPSLSSEVAKAQLDFMLRASRSTRHSGAPDVVGREEREYGRQESEREAGTTAHGGFLAIEEYHLTVQELLAAVLALRQVLQARKNGTEDETVNCLRRLTLAGTESPSSVAKSCADADGIPERSRKTSCHRQLLEELQGHVNCAKVFLEQHVKFGTPYVPGSSDNADPCKSTRSLYMKCMQERKVQGLDGDKVALSLAQLSGPPKPCEMELSMHGTCVANQLERTQKLGEKYWTQGGEDKCLVTRANYEQCMFRSLRGDTDSGNSSWQTADLEKNIGHLQVNLPNK
ncbi:putative jmjC domain-containing protein [Neospora caninum Liverpool]|uniref:Putative jmjC domain-containing protein n=1 Tax=Neospora caninum (strain Liverpool) TaxID=572307 RepID=F0VM69_NEOCL|nr:putative jmjC domain-containing protein [Neospora caninum Liverpool]CBZ54347.1 putative jmjC domain-containing protein [Neospora caninum Liverpool]|eukprot:XP_003884378.1 putative jmjC domain-containing protein [Neospora caninum Liverpool]